ncbi:hypothetical protein [Nonomuraea sp. B19D2]|uniref:phage tail protein n=1 Tax=Nonomuraea sp. B19D2 TaxID=3159561 RepID=UPI0032DA3466
MAQTKVGEAFVEIRPRIAKDFGKQLRDQLERQLKPLTGDLGRNIGDSLGDSLGENFASRFGDHALAAFNDIEFAGKGSTIGQQLGEEFGDGFSTQARERISDFGRDVEVDLRTSFTRVSESASKAGRDIEGNLTQHLSGALGSARNLATGFGQLASSAVLTTGSLATAAGAMGAAAQGALALGAALAPAAGSLAALPGLLLTLGAAKATLTTIFSGLEDAFGAALTNRVIDFQQAADLLPPIVRAVAYEIHGFRSEVTDLRETVQEAFFSHLVGEFDQLRNLLPNVKEGMSGVADVFGEAGREVLDFAGDVQTASAVSSIFHSLRDSVAQIVPEIDILLSGFRDLGVVGAGFISDLSPGIAGLVDKLGWFAYHAAASGDALRWMENALDVFRQLGAIVGDVGGIVAALFRAMNTAGTDALGVIGKLVDGVHTFLDSAKGQETLVAIFRGLADIGSALIPVVTALAIGIGSLAPIIGQIAQLIGPILTTAVQALAPALATLGPALVAVFRQLGSAVTILAQSGALQAVATALGSILVAIAPILPPLAQLISLLVQGLAYVITTWVAPALSKLVSWISQAVDWLTGEGLSEDTWLSRTINFIYTTVAPLFQQAGEIISRVFGDIVQWFTDNQDRVSEWGTKLQEIITVAAQVISQLFEGIALAWDTFGGPLLNIIANVFDGILGVIDGVLTAIKGLFDIVLGVLTGDWERAWNGVKELFSGIWDAIVAIAETIWNNFIEQFKAALALVDDDWEEHWNQVSDFAEDIWRGIVDWLKARVADVGRILDWFGSLPGKFSQWFGEVKNAVVSRFNDVVSFVQSIPSRIQGAFTYAGSWLYNAGRAIVQGLWNGIVSLWNWVVSNWNNMVTNLINIVKSILGIASPSKVMHEMGEFLSMGLARGINASAGLVDKAVTGLAEGVTDAWGSPELAIPAWQNPNAGRLPATNQPAGNALVTGGVGSRVYDITLNAVPSVPTERQIVDVLDYADALYATT